MKNQIQETSDIDEVIQELRSWGGKRSGSGRPRSEQKNIKMSISLPYDVREKLKNLCAQNDKTISGMISDLIRNQI
jgi:hypothetical protein